MKKLLQEYDLKNRAIVNSIVTQIAEEIVKQVTEAVDTNPALGRFLTTSSQCRTRLKGLRLAQFERFCFIMRTRPETLPYHAAQQAISELDGVGGYKNASSLQRYALNYKHLYTEGGAL